MKKKPRIGRPPKKQSEKYANPVRQVGRWDDESWDKVRRAAEIDGVSVAEFVRNHLMPIVEAKLSR